MTVDSHAERNLNEWIHEHLLMENNYYYTKPISVGR